jgi:CBS domain-containing protein
MKTEAVKHTSGPPSSPYIGPPFERAKVHDAMRVGLVTCRPETSLRDVARMMATYQIHCVLVADLGGPAGDRPWSVVSDLDVVASAGVDLDRRTAVEVASTELVAVASNESLERAAQLMREHDVHHLVAVQPETGQPVGVISTLGIAAALA